MICPPVVLHRCRNQLHLAAEDADSSNHGWIFARLAGIVAMPDPRVMPDTAHCSWFNTFGSDSTTSPWFAPPIVHCKACGSHLHYFLSEQRLVFCIIFMCWALVMPSLINDLANCSRLESVQLLNDRCFSSRELKVINKILLRYCYFSCRLFDPLCFSLLNSWHRPISKHKKIVSTLFSAGKQELILTGVYDRTSPTT